jgi:hypothetical protein
MTMAISARDWVSIRVLGVVSALVLFLFYTGRAEAEPTLLTWTAPTTDEAGVEFPSGLILKYWLYGRVSDSNKRYGKHQAEYFGTEADLAKAPRGCYDLYLTAIRTDTGQESAPSNEVVACFGLECGEVGLDGRTGACEGDAPPDDKPPSPTPETQPLAPGAPLEPSMGYGL